MLSVGGNKLRLTHPKFHTVRSFEISFFDRLLLFQEETTDLFLELISGHDQPHVMSSPCPLFVQYVIVL